MLDSFDSRALRLTDCYGQRFMRAGTFQYNVVPAFGQFVTDERPFRVTVVKRTAKTAMTQHNLVVRGEQGKFRVEPAEITVETGDLLLWNCPDRGAGAYAVVGDKEFFASSRLANESGYSHAFGSAGEYEWADAYGSRAAGVVRVKDPGCKDAADFQRWRKLLAEGALVMITDGHVEPREVEIVTGQTVFFAVVKGPGISITDRRLLHGKEPQRPRREVGAVKAEERTPTVRRGSR
jgi:plastocyanin